MEQAAQRKESATEPKKSAAPVHERPATTTPQTESREPVERSQTQTARATAQAGSAGKPTERPVVSSVKEKTDMPAVTERQPLSGSSSHSDRPLPKAAAPATAEQEPQRQSIKERSSTVKRESTRKEKFRTATEVKKGEKK